jgi:hypothetical protein
VGGGFMDTAWRVLFVLGAVYIIGSSLIWSYWRIHPDTRWHEDRIHGYIVCLGTCMGLLLCFFRGSSTLLFFVPESWGFCDDEGEFTTVRSSVSYIVALVATFGVFSVVRKKEVLEEANRELRAELDALRNGVPHD